MYLKDEGVKHRDCLMASEQRRRDGHVRYGHRQPKWCGGSRGEKTIEEESGVGETHGDPGLQRHHSN